MNLRKIALLVVIAALIAGVAAPASFAANGPLTKLGRGLANCLTFPIEIPTQMYKIYSASGFGAMATYGVVKGVAVGIFRALVGVYEVGTFPIPIPSEYKPILTEPEFMLENFQE